ncbi:hypothetical protein MMC07_005963 [Pseudocyphellaria aurata]|nr:hypothetical protein [Pseudocyphellaria aurata]
MVKKSDPRRNIPPDRFLTDPTTMQSISQKTELILTKESAKRFVLTPSAIDQDQTISHYHSRVEGEYIVAKTEFKPIVAGIKSLKEETRNLKEEAKRRNEADLMFHLANLAIDLTKFAAEKLGRHELTTQHSTQQLIAFGLSLDVKQMRKCGIPSKYKVLFQNIRKVVDKRNEHAHESKASFARLLLGSRMDVYYFHSFTERR